MTTRPTPQPVIARTPKEAPKPPELDPGQLDRHVWDLPVDAKRIKGLGPITGRVNSSGSIDGGTGFTVNRSATGVYDVTFNAPFADVPTVLLTVGVSSGLFARLDAQAATGFTAHFRTGGAVDTNTEFNFVAFTTN